MWWSVSPHCGPLAFLVWCIPWVQDLPHHTPLATFCLHSASYHNPPRVLASSPQLRAAAEFRDPAAQKFPWHHQWRWETSKALGFTSYRDLENVCEKVPLLLRAGLGFMTLTEQQPLAVRRSQPRPLQYHLSSSPQNLPRPLFCMISWHQKPCIN